MSTVAISVNGQGLEVADGTTLAAVVARWSASGKGIAVARNGEVVPRSAWPSTGVRQDDEVEIVTAVAGG